MDEVLARAMTRKPEPIEWNETNHSPQQIARQAGAFPGRPASRPPRRPKIGGTDERGHLRANVYGAQYGRGLLLDYFRSVLLCIVSSRLLPSVIGGPDGCLGIPVLNEARSEEKSVDEPNDNDGDQNEYPVGN